ncbi:dual specificity protein phosphatase 12-like [Styela clava]
MHVIEDNLCLGSIKDTNEVDNLQKEGIGYILTLDIKPLASNLTGHFCTKFVPLEDIEAADILGKLPECLSFCDNAVKNGKLLVHCHAGVSRSVCIVTAYLMKKYSITLMEAEERVRAVKGDIQMNAGFVHQLLLFETMKWKVDEDHPVYKKHKFKMLKHEIENEGHQQLSSSFIADNPMMSSNKSGSNSCVYKCKKCRKPVFEQRNIYPHEIDSSKAFHAKLSEINTVMKCSSYFLEPIKWMEKNITSNLNGRLDCPYCSFRIGRFNWAGTQCSCGRWVTPALQIHASNVDKTAIN